MNLGLLVSVSKLQWRMLKDVIGAGLVEALDSASRALGPVITSLVNYLRKVDPYILL